MLAILLAFMCARALGAATELIPLEPNTWRSVSFSNIPETAYELKDGELQARVTKSSSLLVMPFKSPRKVTAVSFEWKVDGDIHMPTSELETSKRGDDSRLKLAVLHHGPAPFIPFFAPAWIKAVKETLRHPTDRATNLTLTKRVKEGATWQSPYSSSIQHVAIGGTPERNGWHRVHYRFDKPVETVGLWLMADGDDTGSSFTTSLRRLEVTFEE